MEASSACVSGSSLSPPFEKPTQKCSMQPPKAWSLPQKAWKAWRKQKASFSNKVPAPCSSKSTGRKAGFQPAKEVWGVVSCRHGSPKVPLRRAGRKGERKGSAPLFTTHLRDKLLPAPPPTACLFSVKMSLTDGCHWRMPAPKLEGPLDLGNLKKKQRKQRRQAGQEI